LGLVDVGNCNVGILRVAGLWVLESLLTSLAWLRQCWSSQGWQRLGWVAGFRHWDVAAGLLIFWVGYCGGLWGFVDSLMLAPAVLVSGCRPQCSFCATGLAAAGLGRWVQGVTAGWDSLMLALGSGVVAPLVLGGSSTSGVLAATGVGLWVLGVAAGPVDVGIGEWAVTVMWSLTGLQAAGMLARCCGGFRVCFDVGLGEVLWGPLV
jgi:hypothetical protein